MLSYFLLALSIGLELFATTMLKASDGFTQPLQTIGCVLGYVGSFYTMTHVLNYIPLSITYATWSGVGLVMTALISVFIFSEGYAGPGSIGNTERNIVQYMRHCIE